MSVYFTSVISSTYGDSHFVPRGANKSATGRIAFQRKSECPISRVSTTFLIVMHPRRETQVMHFIARFNSSVRLFNQTSLPGAAAKRRRVRPFSNGRTGQWANGRVRDETKTISSAESDLARYRYFAPREASLRRRGRVVKRFDNVGSRYSTYFSGHLSGFALRVSGREGGRTWRLCIFISPPRNNMLPIHSRKRVLSRQYFGSHHDAAK